MLFGLGEYKSVNLLHLLLDHSCQHVLDDRLRGHEIDGDTRGLLNRDATERAAGGAVEFADHVQRVCNDDVV